MTVAPQLLCHPGTRQLGAMSASVQRRALEEELRLVLEQKATIEAQLAAFRSGGRPAALKSLKRNSSVMPAKTHVPATKKQKVTGC